MVIADDGPGIRAEDRERVFERFTRLQDARDRDSGGSGLGLAIVRELISQQGGSISLADTTVAARTDPALRDPALPDPAPNGPNPGDPGLSVRIRLPPISG